MFRTHRELRAVLITGLLFAVAALIPCEESNAGIIGVNEATTLADLVSGQDTIIVGDKLFDNFVYTPAAGAPAAEDVSVAGIIRDLPFGGQQVTGYGLQFSGSFVAGGLSGPQLLEAGLGFDVTVLNDLYLISDVHLDGTTFVRGTGDALITENFIGIDVPSLSINELRVDDVLLNSQSSDGVLFSDVLDGVIGFSKISVLKDINIEAGSNTPFDRAEITTFTQLFTQTQIPEPTTLGMACLAMACVACGRKRNS